MKHIDFEASLQLFITFITEFLFFYLDFDNMDVINVINLCNHKNLRTFGNMSLEHIDA